MCNTQICSQSRDNTLYIIRVILESWSQYYGAIVKIYAKQFWEEAIMKQGLTIKYRLQ